MKPKKFSFKRFKEIYSQVTRLTVEVLLQTSEGIVLTKREIEPYRGMWHIPGGTVLYGEKLLDAVERVAKEELGVNVKAEKLLGYIEYSGWEKLEWFGWTVGIVFLSTIKSGKLRGNSQGKTIGFFKTLPRNVIPEQRKFIEKNLLDL